MGNVDIEDKTGKKVRIQGDEIHVVKNGKEIHVDKNGIRIKRVTEDKDKGE